MASSRKRINNKTALPAALSTHPQPPLIRLKPSWLVLLAGWSVAIGYSPPIVIGLAVLLTILDPFLLADIRVPRRRRHCQLKQPAKRCCGRRRTAQADYILLDGGSLNSGRCGRSRQRRAWVIRFAFCYKNQCIHPSPLTTLTAVINLRGVQRARSSLGRPTCLFAMLVLIISGLYSLFTTANAHLDSAATMTFLVGTPAQHDGQRALIWLPLRAFAAGCPALTTGGKRFHGGLCVQATRGRERLATLTWMAAIMTTLILGTGWPTDLRVRARIRWRTGDTGFRRRAYTLGQQVRPTTRAAGYGGCHSGAGCITFLPTSRA